jgi:integrase/recombinase XerD
MSAEVTVLPPAPVVLVRTEPEHASSDDHLLELWLHGRSPHTQRAYRADVERFRAGTRKSLSAVTLADLQDFANSLGELSAASRYRSLSAVKSLLAFGHRIGYLRFDVGRVLRLPSVRNSLAERILPEADLHRMLSLEPDERNRALLLLLYASGVRRGKSPGCAGRICKRPRTAARSPSSAKAGKPAPSSYPLRSGNS